MENDFSQSLLHPGDLKAAVEVRLNALLEPIRKIFQAPELVQLVKAAYPPPAKPSKGAPTPADDVVAPHRLDIRVGKIVQVDRHPEADSLYVEKIDLGINGFVRVVVRLNMSKFPILIFRRAFGTAYHC